MPRQRARRFLIPGGGKGSSGLGYATQPLRELRPGGDPSELVSIVATQTCLVDEPEFVGPAILDAYGESARFYESLRHQAEVAAAREARKTLEPEDRVADIKRRAKEKHVNIAGDLAKVEHDLRKARAGGRKNFNGIVRRIERLEAWLDGPVDLRNAA